MTKCESCGARIPHGVAFSLIGPKTYCAPAGAGCHRLGQLNATWTLTALEAKTLLEEHFEESA